MMDLRRDQRGAGPAAGRTDRRSAGRALRPLQLHSLDDYDRLKQVAEARRTSQSRYAKARLMHSVRTHSNGESAFLFFTERIRPGALYLLDEPKTAWPPPASRSWRRFLADAARFDRCQFVVCDPFAVFAGDARRAGIRPGQRPRAPAPLDELPGVRATYEFFRDHAAALRRKHKCLPEKQLRQGETLTAFDPGDVLQDTEFRDCTF